MKNVIIDILDYLKYQVKNDKCTTQQMQRIADLAKEELHMQGTLEEIAEFYGQSRSNVSNLISRRPMPKSKRPQRRVLYDIGWISSLVPESWRRKRKE